MPNWTTIRITQEDRTIPPIWDQFLSSKEDEKENKFFDFNKLIPMPEELNVTSGGTQDKAIAYYLTDRLTKSAEECNLSAYINNFFCDDWPNEILKRIQEDELSEEEAEKLYQAGKQYVSNKEKYGHCTWYEWCCEHWGTKWNARNTWYSQDDPYVVSFYTAWSAPMGIMEELAKRFPDVEIFWGIEYEGDSFQEIVRSYGGKMERVKEYEGYWDEDEDEELFCSVFVKKRSVERQRIEGENFIVFPSDFPELEGLKNLGEMRAIAAVDLTEEIRKEIFNYEYEPLEGEEKEFYEKYM